MKHNAFNVYRQNRLHGIQDASPVRLVAMMLDEAVACSNAAAAACENGNIATRGEAVGKALAIIDVGLLSALDMEKGGEVAVNLAKLYSYCIDKLMEGNIASNPAPLRECANILSEIREGWRGPEALDRGA